MIRAVFVDIDDTLLDFGEGSRDAMTAALEHFALDHPDNLYDIFKSTNDALWQNIEKGELTREELYRIRWNLIFNKVGISADGVAFEAVFHRNLEETAIPIPGAIEMLKHLHRKYIVCAASNAPHQQQLLRLKKSGMLRYIHNVFTSEQFGCSKPSAEFFEKCFAELGGITPRDTLIIGDSLTADIRGGAAVGMKTCWFNPHLAAPSVDITPDLTVRSLSDIIDIL